MTLKSRLFVAVLIDVGVLGQIAMPADAGPCTKMIAQFEVAVRQSTDIRGTGPLAAQSIDAQLGRQPTPSSVEQADVKAQRTFDAALKRAKMLDAKGKSRCAQALHDAETLYDLK